MKANKHDVLIEAVNKLKTCNFKATAIKVELEAQLNRGYEDGCDYCDEGRQECSYCDGYGSNYCNTCEESGRVSNPDHTVDNDEPEWIDCPDCESRGRTECDDCEGTGNVDCDECDGGETTGYDSTEKCHDFILKQLLPLGLAEAIPVGESYLYANNFRPKLPLVFSKFYNDGSVDSEHTFTLMLDNPENIFLLPKILEAFTALAEEIQGDKPIDVEGAGMHMALLSTPNGYYDKVRGQETTATPEFRNYRDSMQMLLPALYFLGSSNEKSRRIGYRLPSVGRGDESFGTRYHAINYAWGALEFRLFDTCYDNPEAILDFVVVMSKTMKYWRPKYKKFCMKGIDRVYFGNDMNNTLKRFYMHKEVLDVLRGGLRILKPDYYTIRELKQQRNFHVTKATIDGSIKKQRKEVELEYKEYEQRFAWRLEIKRHDYTRRLMEEKIHYAVRKNLSPLDMQRELDSAANRYIAREALVKKDTLTYVKDRLVELEQSSRGKYKLEVA